MPNNYTASHVNLHCNNEVKEWSFELKVRLANLHLVINESVHGSLTEGQNKVVVKGKAY